MLRKGTDIFTRYFLNLKIIQEFGKNLTNLNVSSQRLSPHFIDFFCFIISFIN